ncbi:hypothetical protein VNO77_04716 [Canavalia gladiata]|uniref:Glycosyltransferase n=1 Tax=Canavalia gladiata TaxID=3824 RepID=A0AAN9R9B8_CANGL
MGSEYGSLHIFFFPLMAHGHTIPMVDMAKLFAAKGVRATIITTPLNALTLSKAIEKIKSLESKDIHIQTIKFPSIELGLPEECEHLDSIPSGDYMPSFLRATQFLQEPFEQLLLQQRPNCVVADAFFPWVTDSTAKFGIPRLVFHGISLFSSCATVIMSLYQPYNNTSDDSELFVIPNLPGEIKMTRLQVQDFVMKDDLDFNRFWKEIKESEVNCYGVVVNSFYELEKVYADCYNKVLGRRQWCIGPLSLCKRNMEEITYRGKEVCIDEHECLKWLDKKEVNSVVYVSFGSMVDLPNSQLLEIASGLEVSKQQFIWVVGKRKEEGEEWLPEGFEKRIEGRGLIIRGWAPQVLILEHEAIGAFVTHCGWNSTLEGVTAGVPMVTWPVGAEQFYNEKLVTEVLKIGVSVGVKKWSHFGEDGIKWDTVEKAVKLVMVDEEGKEMRNKAKVLAHMARQAVEEGGSSYSNLNALIQELSSLFHKCFFEYKD